MDYKQSLRDPRWQRRRSEELDAADYVCSWCGADDKMLVCHHWAYEGEPWEAAGGTISVLCEDCHRVADEMRVISRRLLGMLLRAGSDLLWENPEEALNGLRQIEQSRSPAVGFVRWLEAIHRGWEKVKRDFEAEAAG